jgi:hypothetical protein
LLVFSGSLPGLLGRPELRAAELTPPPKTVVKAIQQRQTPFG